MVLSRCSMLEQITLSDYIGRTVLFFFTSRRRHTRCSRDWSSDVCSSDLGKDAGKSGRVLWVNGQKNTVVVEHVGIIKRHTRPNPSKNVKGGIIEKEGSINEIGRASCRERV